MGLIESKRIERLYDQVLRNRTNCRFEDIERLLTALGFTVRKTSGSHVVFKRADKTISVPRRLPVKEHYVAEVLRLTMELLGGSG
ncbi:MAG: type II toxin-antitoxin system HicA family toxin [Candidatus Aquilonibacter sp.]